MYFDVAVFFRLSTCSWMAEGAEDDGAAAGVRGQLLII